MSSFESAAFFSVIFVLLRAVARAINARARRAIHCGCYDHKAARRRYISEIGRAKAGLLSFDCPAL
jgi:hypothetical protein